MLAAATAVLLLLMSGSTTAVGGGANNEMGTFCGGKLGSRISQKQGEDAACSTPPPLLLDDAASLLATIGTIRRHNPSTASLTNARGSIAAESFPPHSRRELLHDPSLHNRCSIQIPIILALVLLQISVSLSLCVVSVANALCWFIN
jgi:hypothetical protein